MVEGKLKKSQGGGGGGVRITTANWKPNYKDLFGKGPYLNKNPQHFIPELIKKLSIAFTVNGIHEIQGKKFS